MSEGSYMNFMSLIKLTGDYGRMYFFLSRRAILTLDKYAVGGVQLMVSLCSELLSRLRCAVLLCRKITCKVLFFNFLTRLQNLRCC